MTGLRLPRLLRVTSFRFAALYVVLFAVSSVVLGAAVYLRAQSSLQAQLRDRVQVEADFLAAEFRSGGLDHLTRLVTARGRGTSALDYLLQTRTGTHLAGEMPGQADLQPGWRIVDVPQDAEDGDRPERVRTHVSDLGGGLMLAIGGDLSQTNNLEGAVAKALLWTIGLAAPLGIAGGLLLSRAFLRRIDAISRTAEAIIDGDLSSRIPTRGADDDLDHLAATLNRMLDRIGVLMDSLRQVSSDVAHDLRTPLTRLYQTLEGAHLRARSIEDFRAANEAALRESQALLDTFGALLHITQVEGTASRPELADTDLSLLVEQVVDAYRPDLEDAGYLLAVAVEPDLHVQGVKALLGQALANLLENVARHTPTGTRVRLGLRRTDPDTVTLRLDDNGPGVDETDLPRLTDRFYRADRSRSTTGNGLGLSLVRAIADLHHARLLLERLHPGFAVTLVFQTA